jgi:hypothetical protein
MTSDREAAAAAGTSRVFGVALFLAAAVLGMMAFWLPEPRPVDAPAATFSALRAFNHVRAIAQRPHPATSADNRRVRAYIAETLRGLGLRVDVQEGTEAKTAIVNLYAELPGREPGPPRVLFVSHHDSVPQGPGAADATAGVATLIETIRALKAEGTNRNTLAFLFTDGEEFGLLGARLFVRTQPERLRDIEVVVNLEARGNHGPVVMFQTGPGNLGLARMFGASVPYPVASSFSQDVYRHLPNDTDFTVFMRAGKHGYNFAFVGGVEFYHTSKDAPENLSLRTLQHYGDCVLPVARSLARADDAGWARLAGPGDAVYGGLVRGVIFAYPATWIPFLTGLTVVAYLAILGYGYRQRRLRIWPSLRAALASLAAALIVVLIGVGAVAAWGHLPDVRRMRIPGLNLPADTAVLILLLVLASLLACGLGRRFARASNPAEALAGGLLWWIFMGCAAACALPGATFLAQLPALAGILALVLAVQRGPQNMWLGVARVILASVPAPLLLTPVVGLLYQTLTLTAAPLCLFVAGLACGLLPRSETLPPSDAAVATPVLVPPTPQPEP